MSFKKTALAFILVYVKTVSLLAMPQTMSSSTLESKSKDAAHLVMNMDGPQGNTQFSYTEIPLDDPNQLSEMLLREETRTSDILLSTDTPEVYSAVAEAVQKTEKQSNRLFRFMPIGKLASAKEKFAAGWANYKHNVADSVKYDKLGLSIVIITTAYDSFIWIHSASLDVYQKSAMVMMNVIFAAAFALDRDMWTKMTVPLRHRIMKTIDKISRKMSGTPESETSYARKVLAAQFLANLSFSAGFQLLRTSVLSYQDLAARVMTSELWLISFKVAVITTLASFAWSELMTAADSEKHPVAKNALKRIADVRNIVMSQLASMGMVLQPNVYGYSPIVAIVTSGSIGLLALMKSNRVIEWLEANRISQVFFKSQRKLETFVNDAAANLQDIVVTPGGNAGMCSALFN